MRLTVQLLSLSRNLYARLFSSRMFPCRSIPIRTLSTRSKTVVNESFSRLQDQGSRCCIDIHRRVRTREELGARSKDDFELAKSSTHSFFETVDGLNDASFDGRLASEQVSKSMEGGLIGTWRLGVGPGSRWKKSLACLPWISCVEARCIQEARVGEGRHTVWLRSYGHLQLPWSSSRCSVGMADMHVAADRMMYVGLHAHKNLLLDRCTALQTLDACLQFLLPGVTILANPQTSFILASLDLQSK